MEIKERKARVNISISKGLLKSILDGKAEAETPFEYMVIKQIQKAGKGKLMLNSIYGVSCGTFDEDVIKRLQEQMDPAIAPVIYTDTDSAKIVSRETLKLDKQDAQIMIDLARKIDVECGQVSCKECIMYSEEERYQTHCLLSQLNYVRRKYSDREE